MVPPSLCTHPQSLCTHADTHTLRCPQVHDSHTHRQNAHSLPPTSHKCAAVMCPPASGSRHTNEHENGSDRFKYSLNLTLLRWVCHGVLNPRSCSHQASSLPSYAQPSGVLLYTYSYCKIGTFSFANILSFSKISATILSFT